MEKRKFVRKWNKMQSRPNYFLFSLIDKTSTDRLNNCCKSVN